MSYNGQAEQDKYVLSILKQKRNGFFVEIGSNDPIKINNTYKLEKEFDWKGIMIEYEASYLPAYKIHRPNSIHVIKDATKIDYKDLFATSAAPASMDYLQIDLEVDNASTIIALKLLDTQILDTYKFATVTFEHDIYRGDYFSTRTLSREIFERRGYIHAFKDIHNDGNPSSVYEDWYVHPDLVDMEYVNRIKAANVKNYEVSPTTGKSIAWGRIEY
jgi:hypothetical protein